MDKKKTAVIFVSAVSLFLLAVLVPFGVQQIRLDRLDISGKEIVSAELIVYAGDAFSSNIVAGKVITDSEVIDNIYSQLNMKKISLYNPTASSTVLFITFADGSVMDCFVNGDNIGFDYGRVWVKVDGFGNIVDDIL